MDTLFYSLLLFFFVHTSHKHLGLTGLQSLTNLMELYMCSNRIMNVKEVQHLKTVRVVVVVVVIVF